MPPSQANPSPAAGPATLARHRVRDGIQRLILAGRYRPGQRLIQQELARHFGVAQSVVRESLLELQFCGLVEAVDNLGMFVSGLDPQLLIQAYEIREVFEGLAAPLCCQHASRADISELAQLVDRVHRLGQAGELEMMSALDRQFHYRTILISRNRLLARLTEGYRVLGMFVSVGRDIGQVRDEHLDIVEAIRENRPEQAERFARGHVRATRQTIERQVSEGTFVPHWVGEAEDDGTAPEAQPGKRAASPRRTKKRKK